MKVLRVNDKIKACPQSEVSDVELDIDVELEGVEYTLMLEGKSKITSYDFDNGDYFNPQSCESTQSIEMLEESIYKDGSLVPMFNTSFTWEMLENLLIEYTS